MQSLPGHRQLLSGLIDSIARAHQSEDDGATTTRSTTTSLADADAQPRPIPSGCRQLLATLHVIFPTLVLPALDLLDRRLVTRVGVEKSSPTPPGSAKEAEPLARGGRTEPRGSNTIYIVKSLASTLPPSRRRRQQQQHYIDDAASAKLYIVRLSAWSCSCPSFTLDAFPPVKQQPHEGKDLGSASRNQSTEERRPQVFGGLSLDSQAGDGHTAEDVPCCKHILACILAEHCVDDMRSYVEERRVNKNELVGIIAGM